jgi:hypothetical protein
MIAETHPKAMLEPGIQPNRAADAAMGFPLQSIDFQRI